MHSMSRVREGKRQFGEIRHSGEILHNTGGGHLGVCVFVFVCLYFFICVFVYNSALLGDTAVHIAQEGPEKYLSTLVL